MRDRNIGKEFLIPLATSPVITKARTNLEPGVGAPIYCDLGFNTVEHSGIYVGNNEVVHLNGNGQIEKVSLDGFRLIKSLVCRSLLNLLIKEY